MGPDADSENAGADRAKAVGLRRAADDPIRTRWHVAEVADLDAVPVDLVDIRMVGMSRAISGEAPGAGVMEIVRRYQAKPV